MTERECPSACDVRITQLEKRMDKTDEIHGKLFDKVEDISHCVSKRVKTGTLLALAVIIVAVLGGAFTLLYNQGSGIGDKIGIVHQRITDVRDKVHTVETEVVKVQEQVKATRQVQQMMKEDIAEIKKNGNGN